jgi:Flp pilus assembly protein TadD
MMLRIPVAVTLLLICLSAVSVRAWASIPSPSKSGSQVEWKSLEQQAHSDYYNGKYRQAILLFRQLLQLEPKNPKMLTDLGNMEYQLSNFTGALHYFEQVFTYHRS